MDVGALESCRMRSGSSCATADDARYAEMDILLANSRREVTPSFWKILQSWYSTVLVLMNI